METYDIFGNIIDDIHTDTTDWNSWFDNDVVKIKDKHTSLKNDKAVLKKKITLKQKRGKLFCNLSTAALKYGRIEYTILKSDFRLWPKNTVVRRATFYISDEYGKSHLRTVKIPLNVNELWLNCIKISTPYKGSHAFKSQLLIDAMMLQVSKIKKKNPDFVWYNHPKNINGHLQQIVNHMKVSLSDFIRKAVIYPFIGKYKDAKLEGIAKV